MIKISVSQAARRLGVSRASIQDQVNSGKLQTHEGYVTSDSIRLAYPNCNFHSECDIHLEKIQQIKEDAKFKAAVVDVVRQENEQALMEIIATLKSKLYQEQLKNKNYKMIFMELDEQLETFEKCCHEQDKTSLSELQVWIGKIAH